jgi:argininosuccinate lyase
MLEISRFAEDMLTINSLIPGAINPPIEHVATSSIMPHKRNLVTMEIARARASKVLGYVVASQSIYKGPPTATT